MQQGLTPQQIQQFHDDGFLIVRGMLPRDAYQPLIDELETRIDDLANQAVDAGLLDPANTFPDAPFATRLSLVSDVCSDRNWLWQQIKGKSQKTAGMFVLRTHPALLDVAESLIGPEILAHPQSNLRVKLPDHADSAVPWHQDLAYLVPEEAGETLVINFWIPLVAATAANGCLQVIRGSHKLGLLPHRKIPTVSEFAASIGIADRDIPDGEIVPCEVEVGDALITMERVVHRSTSNTTDGVRWSLDVRYSALGLPTGREKVPGFVARSRNHPERVAGSHHDWIKLLVDAGLDPIKN